jgi:gliding motility-associated-like protein
MKKIWSFILFALTLQIYSQNCPHIGPDLILPCGVNQATLTADLSQCGPGALPQGTSNYGVTNIPYVAQVNNGTLVQLGDDVQSGIFNIGFTFCFYGSNYTQFRIGSNGWVSLGAGVQPGTFTSVAIPNGGAGVPKNCIMGPWQDWNPGIGGQVRYQVQGTAPCRRLVVSWIGVPMYSCTNLQGTFHIILYESTNVIENHIANKPNCPQWAGGTGVQGIHNLLGNAAVTVPGRNSTQWTTVNNAHRWTPSGGAIQPTWTWYQVGNPNPIGTGLTITVTPPPGGAYYTCQPVYPSCNAGWSTCNAGVGQGPDTILVTPTPNLPPPTVTTQDPLCNNGCDGTIVVNVVGGLAPYVINWANGSNTLTLNNLCSGTYNFSLGDANGCTYNGSALLNNPPPLQPPTITPVNPLCFNDCNGTATCNPIDGIAPWTYLWSNGQTGQTATGLCATNYSVTVTDANGCTSTQTTTLINPPQVTVSPISGSDTVCFLSPLETYTVTNQPPYTYVWTTVGNIVSGQGTNTLNVDWSGLPPGFVPGAVSVTAFNASGCSSTTSVFDLHIYNVVPTINQMGPYCSYDNCENLTATPAGGVFYINGSPVAQFCPQSNGTNDSVIYVYTRSGCSFSDTLNFVVNPQPNITDIDPDDYFIQICEGDTSSITYLINSTLPGTVEWTYGESSVSGGLSQTFGLSEFGTFIVTATLTTPEGCVSLTVTTTITIQECPNELIYIPNTFTPDDNEFNQYFSPVITSGVDLYQFEMQIYNRWGQIIWQSFDTESKWDGTYNGVKCQDGIYTWKIRFGVPKTDEIKEMWGHLTIIK